MDIATHIASIAIEHYRADQEIRKAASAAEVANRAKSQFLANMSHELRTPMTGVLGMLEIALDGPLEEEQREFVATAHQSAGSLVRILNDILEMTRIEAGMLSLEDEPFVLHECVGSVIDIFNAEARHKGLDLILSMTEDLPERVVGDCLRLRQVLTNLVGNAVKFTERGEGGGKGRDRRHRSFRQTRVYLQRDGHRHRHFRRKETPGVSVPLARWTNPIPANTPESGSGW